MLGLGLPLKIWAKLQDRRFIRKYKREIDTLVEKGLVLGKNVTIDRGAYIDYHYPYLISIGDNSTITRGCCILAHDATLEHFKDRLGGMYIRLGRVVIKENVIISVNSTVMPGVTIGPNVLVAAGSLVNKDVPPNSCVAGVPARFYAKFDDLVEQHKTQIRQRPVIEGIDLGKMLDERLRDRIRKAVENGDAYAKDVQVDDPYLLNPDNFYEHK
jgi:maltose O-acetyltransferase